MNSVYDGRTWQYDNRPWWRVALDESRRPSPVRIPPKAACVIVGLAALLVASAFCTVLVSGVVGTALGSAAFGLVGVQACCSIVWVYVYYGRAYWRAVRASECPWCHRRSGQGLAGVLNSYDAAYETRAALSDIGATTPWDAVRQVVNDVREALEAEEKRRVDLLEGRS